MIAVRLATYAMRTRFEVVLVGEEPRFLRSAGEEALGEVEELERLLSRFEEDSDIGRINRMAAFVPVRVDARTFSLLQRAVALSVQTNGAFDVTVGTWWRSEKAGGGNVPVGFWHLLLEETTRCVRLAHAGVQVDLGGIGKGYALERAAALLMQAGIEHAFLHGGTSSAFSWGHDENGRAWQVAIAHPLTQEVLATVPLNFRGLSVSVADPTRSTNPTIDPRTGIPVRHTLLAAVLLPSPTDSEAWSTALLVLGEEGLSLFQHYYPDGWALLLTSDGRILTPLPPASLSRRT